MKEGGRGRGDTWSTEGCGVHAEMCSGKTGAVCESEGRRRMSAQLEMETL